MTSILAIDPGTEKSGQIWLDNDGKPLGQSIAPNGDILQFPHGVFAYLAIEVPEPRGEPFSRHAMIMCEWIGRFMERWGDDSTVIRLGINEIRLHLCGRCRGIGDPNIRAALIDRWGGKEKAIGNKKNPGPLYGITSHCWSALAVAVTAQAKLNGETK